MNQTEYINAGTVGGKRARIATSEHGPCRHNELAPAERRNDLPVGIECKDRGSRFSLEAAKIMIEMKSQ